MRDQHGGHTGASPQSEGPGNTAWQRTQYLMSQMHGREN